MRRFAIAVPGGFACAYRSPFGYVVPEGEYRTMAGAQAAADRANAQVQALAALRAAREAVAHPRRSVRYFEPDAFA